MSLPEARHIAQYLWLPEHVSASRVSVQYYKPLMTECWPAAFVCKISLTETFIKKEFATRLRCSYLCEFDSRPSQSKFKTVVMVLNRF